MLRFGLERLNGNGTPPHVPDEALSSGPLGLRTAPALQAKPLSVKAADTQSNQRVRQDPSLGKQGGEFHFPLRLGNHGKKALVRRW